MLDPGECGEGRAVQRVIWTEHWSLVMALTAQPWRGCAERIHDEHWSLVGALTAQPWRCAERSAMSIGHWWGRSWRSPGAAVPRGSAMSTGHWWGRSRRSPGAEAAAENAAEEKAASEKARAAEAAAQKVAALK